MIWKYLALFGLSMIKFLFAPAGGPPAKLNYFETYLSCIAGAIVCASIFYFAANFFFKRAREKKLLAIQKAKETGVEFKRKKQFTKLNKFIVRTKKKIGKVGICFFVPLFCSIPVGSLIVAKFYSGEKSTFPLIVLGIVINGAVTTGIVYGIAAFF